MNTFIQDQRINQINWRYSKEFSREMGTQNGKQYEHIVPKKEWEETLFPDIKTPLIQYLEDKKVKEHSGVHNLMSSWVLSANLYFPVSINGIFKKLMLQFLKQKVSGDITEITETHLEFAFDKGSVMHPAKLLGEMDGNRGSGQTSPDVAFEVKTVNGKGLILTECKYSEHSFYSCSARSIKGRKEKPDNPDPKRCMNLYTEEGYKAICHQTVWGRKYWSLLSFAEGVDKTIFRCPAATAGYQLFRQQALAEGIAKSGEYDLVVSSVAFDNRNTTLINCLKSSGIMDFQQGWGSLWSGKAQFHTWHHQEWVQFVRENDNTGECKAWLEYMKVRYGY